MARIEIKSKAIKGIDILGNLTPQHLYIVNIKDNGSKIAYRGGPEGGDNMKNWLFDDLKVTRLLYNKNHPDYDKKSNHPSKLLISGSDGELAPMIEKINNAMDIINSNNYDYKVVIPGVTFGSWQNSNTIARYLIEAAGIKFELPKHSNGMSVLAPGWDEQIAHSLFDETGVGVLVEDLYKNIGMKIAEKARIFIEEYTILERRVKEIYNLLGEYHKKEFRECISKYEDFEKKMANAAPKAEDTEIYSGKEEISEQSSNLILEFEKELVTFKAAIINCDPSYLIDEL